MKLIDLVQIWALKNNKDNPWDIYSTVELDSRIDRDDLVAEIIQKCGGLEPVHNTTDTFVFFTEHFFKREKENITRMLDVMLKDYDPLENFSRTEELKKESISSTVLDEESKGSSTDNGRIEEKTSAYNEDLYQPSAENLSTNSNQYSDERDYTRANTFKGEDTNVIHGINGLITRQDLVEKERKLRAFNVIKWIVEKYSCEYFYQVF